MMFEPDGVPTIAGLAATEWESLLGYGLPDGVTSPTFKISECPEECKEEKHYYRFGWIVGKGVQVLGLVLMVKYAGGALTVITGGLI